MSLNFKSKHKSTTTSVANNQVTSELGQSIDGGTGLALSGIRSENAEINVNLLDAGAIEQAFEFAEESLNFAQDSLTVIGDSVGGLLSTSLASASQSNDNILAAKNAESDSIIKIVGLFVAAVVAYFIMRGFKK